METKINLINCLSKRFCNVLYNKKFKDKTWIISGGQRGYIYP